MQQITRAFDYVTFGVVLLDMHATVQFANRSAWRMAALHDGMSLKGSFRPGGTKQTYAFQMAFETVKRAEPNSSDIIACLPMTQPDEQRGVLFVICGLHSPYRQEACDPAVMVIMVDPSNRQPVAAQALATLFGLTPTEAQVANAFADGKRTDEIAEQFNISATTVNFHKRNLFAKTGTNRQADLIALLLSLPVSEFT